MGERKSIILLKSIQKFGLYDGIKTFYSLSTGQNHKIKIPTAKYSFILRRNTSDIETFCQIYLRNEYDLQLPESPRTIIDGGANMGLFAIKMKNQYPDSKVICVEPDPENFELLQKNLARYEDVVFENKGLWSKNTKLKVSDKYNLGKWGMCVEEDLKDGTIDAISIKNLLDKYSIDSVDLLKLDIECSEKELFRHNVEEWLPRVKTIVIELHDKMEKGCAQSFFHAVNKYFTEYSYDVRGENTIVTNLT